MCNIFVIGFVYMCIVYLWEGYTSPAFKLVRYCYKNLKISKQLPNAMELIICNLLATPASNYTQTQMTV